MNQSITKIPLFAMKIIKKNHNCEFCAKSLSTATHLKQHISTAHADHKDHKCDSCGKSFTQLQDLEKHLHTVHKYDLHTQKYIPQSKSLKTHIQAFHEGHKDHICESCGKSLSRAAVLKKHIYTVHEGHKDHKCESCGKSFSEAGVLKKHIYAVHEGHKDYKCKSCSKSFSQVGNLKKHMHSVHEVQKGQKCESCGKSFSRTRTLQKHIKIIHTAGNLKKPIGHEGLEVFSSKNYFQNGIEKPHDDQAPSNNDFLQTGSISDSKSFSKLSENSFETVQTDVEHKPSHSPENYLNIYITEDVKYPTLTNESVNRETKSNSTRNVLETESINGSDSFSENIFEIVQSDVKYEPKQHLENDSDINAIEEIQSIIEDNAGNLLESPNENIQKIDDENDTKIEYEKDEANYFKCNCEEENKSIATHHCEECAEPLCRSCVKFHQRFEVTQIHDLQEINYYCKCKPDKKLTASKYCDECSEAFCTDCIIAHKRLIVQLMNAAKTTNVNLEVNHVLKSI